MMPSAMKRLRELEQKNSQLKKIIADLTLDKSMLQDIAGSEAKRCGRRR